MLRGGIRYFTAISICYIISERAVDAILQECAN